MLSWKVLISALAFVLLTASASYAYSWDQGSKTTVSVFAAADQRAQESGFGVSFSTKDRDMKDLTYIDLGTYRMVQVSTLTQKNVVGYPMNFGLAFGYSEPKPGKEAYRGITTGLQLVLARTTNQKGLSADVRLCSMSHDINPIKWVTNPDILWGGIGVSYGF